MVFFFDSTEGSGGRIGRSGQRCDGDNLVGILEFF
jgi:hypothetical protein